MHTHAILSSFTTSVVLAATSFAAPSGSVPCGPSAPVQSTLGEFQAWSMARAAYDVAYSEDVTRLVYEVATATRPNFSDTEEARAVIAAQMGDSYELCSTWLSSFRAPGAQFTVATSSEGSTAALDQLVLYAFDLEPLDMADLPPDVADVFGQLDMDAYEAYYYSARFDGTLVHSGMALLQPQDFGDSLLLWPQAVQTSSSYLTGPQVAGLCALNVYGTLDLDLVFDVLWPAYAPPVFTPSGGSDGHFAVSLDPFWECVLAACKAYDQAMKNDAAYSAQWARTNEKNRSAVVLATARSRDAVNAAFRAAEDMTTWGGMTQDQWDDYLDGFYDDAQEEYEAAEEARKQWEKDRKCQNAQDLRSRVLDCLGTNEYPELVDLLNAWVASQCS